MQSEVSAIKQIHGFWLPSGERTLVPDSEDWTYQKDKLDAAMEYVPRRRTCIDIGAHCGFWSVHLAKMFDKVHAFEPIHEHRECFLLNVTAQNVHLHPFALGETEKDVDFYRKPSKTLTTKVVGAKKMYRPIVKGSMRTLDSFGLNDVDFVKIDCEGYEYFVLLGGEALIDRCKPVICVEQKPGNASCFGIYDTAALDLLRAKGYVIRQELKGDYILDYRADAELCPPRNVRESEAIST